MNPLNLNPKVLHAILEFIQIGSTIGALSSIVGTLNPVLGTGAAVIGGIATVLKTKVIGNIPASTP